MYESFQALQSTALACQGCKLCQTRHSVVFGAGSQHAKIMFIGEGPGENEDLQGEPSCPIYVGLLRLPSAALWC